jgi:hypothetical protein
MYGDSGHCFYVDDPAEVAALQAAGQCPINWTPAPAPSWYLVRYADYWSSPVYVNRYVPVSHRTSYTTVINHFESSHQSQISTARTTYTQKAKAAYSAGNGRSYTGGGSENSGTARGATTRSTTSTRVSVGTPSSARSYSSGRRP